MSMEKKVQAKHIKDRTILEAIANPFGGNSIPAKLDGFPEKVVMAKLQKMRDQGLTDFGVVASRPWLTAEGIRRLEELRRCTGSDRSLAPIEDRDVCDDTNCQAHDE